MKLHIASLCLLASASAHCGGNGADNASPATVDPGQHAAAPGAAGTTGAPAAVASKPANNASTRPGTNAGSSAAVSGSDGAADTAANQCGKAQVEPLLWKRGAALSHDLQQGLALPEDQLCRELGQADCIEVHRVPLGMDDPFGTGLYEAVTRPLATTALATDRIVLRACSARVDRDKAGEKAVFGDLDLSTGATSPEVAARVVQTLYQRLLARDPSEQETEVVAELAKDASGAPVSAADFAKLACFIIGTSSEFVLY